jgi:hypothetical protein
MDSHHQSSSKNNNLWIGELENWMDENYITKSAESFSKIKYITKQNRCESKKCKNNA